MQHRQLRSLLSLGTAVTIVMSLTTAARGEDDISPARLIPGDALAALVLRNGKGHLDSFQSSELLALLETTDFAHLVEKNPDLVQARVFTTGLAGSIGASPWQAVGTLFGSETVIALRIEGGFPQWVAVSKLIEPEKVDVMLSLSRILLRLPRPREDGIVPFGDKAFLARFGDYLGLASSKRYLGECMARHETTSEPSLASASFFAELLPRLETRRPLAAAFDLDRFRELRGGSLFHDRIENGFAALLFSGHRDRLEACDAVQAWLGFSVSSIDVLVQARPDGKDPRDPSAAADRFPLPALPRNLGAIAIRRDVASLWEKRDDLLPAQGLGQLLQFAGTLTTLTAGLDFGEELLPALGSDLLFVSNLREVGDARPSPELPAFALLLPLRRPEEIGRRLEMAALQTMSIVNFESARNGRPPLMVDKTRYRDTSITHAEYPEPDDARGPLHVRHNFSPAACVAGDHFVISSSLPLAREIIDAFRNAGSTVSSAVERASTASLGLDSLIRVDATSLRTILGLNRELMADNKVLETAVPREAALLEIDGLLGLLDLVTDLEAVIRASNEELSLDLRLGLKKP